MGASVQNQFKQDFLEDYSDEGLLNELRRVAALCIGKPLTRGRFAEHARVHSSTIRHRFGSWADALIKARLLEPSLRPKQRIKADRSQLDYSDEGLLNELRRVAALCIGSGKPLTCERFTEHAHINISTVRDRFGSWPLALNKAGLSNPSLQPRIRNKDERTQSMIEELRRVADQLLGKVPSINDFDTHAQKHSSDAIRQRFGSWTMALEAASLSPNRNLSKQPYTKSELLANLDAIYHHTGLLPTYNSLSAPPSVIGPKAYERTWGPFSAALFEFHSHISNSTHKQTSDNRTSLTLPSRIRTIVMSDDDLRQELRRIAELLGKSPTQEEVRRHSHVNPATFRSRLGSGWRKRKVTWVDALDACGLPPSKFSRRFTDDDLFENLAIVWTQLGRRPKYDEMKKLGSKNPAETYVARFGSWRTALSSFLKWTESRDPQQPDFTPADEVQPCLEVVESQPNHASISALAVVASGRDSRRALARVLDFKY